MCVVRRGRTAAQRQPGHSEVFTYLLTVTLPKYLMLPPYFEFYEHQRLHYCIVMARICVFGREKYVLMGNILLSLCYFGLQLRLSVLSIDL